MNRNRYLVTLLKLVNTFEIVVSIMLIAGVIVSVPDIMKYYFKILTNDAVLSYEIFQNFLSHVLLLVIAIEFVVLMIAHTDTNIIHLILLVISRKMLVYSDTMLDLLIATIAIAVLFAVRKFLLTGVNMDAEGNENEYSASTPMKILNKRYGFDIDAGETTTIGGYVAGLLIKNAEEPEVGVIVDDGEYIFQIVKMATGGVIETVSVERIDEKIEEDKKKDIKK
ncbi:transporter associated domain-containing protein [Peptoniphilus harei]|uniref:transporter associated domain-containing protein n=1 Tax=Peptoniphilus harei TaxID=54005 RepID=UPI0025908BFE|nr:transporter associated domain-containing protein [Peptoniphilus harei]MDU6743260.1 transporter associated domain-containing protein [Peptoniphilus harei]